MDPLITELALKADIALEDLDEAAKERLEAFAAAVADACAERVERLARERIEEGYENSLGFSKEAGVAVRAMFHGAFDI